MRKTHILPTLLLLLTILSLSSCQLIGDIFKAGMWTGILIVAVVVGLVIFILSRAFGGGGK